MPRNEGIPTRLTWATAMWSNCTCCEQSHGDSKTATAALVAIPYVRDDKIVHILGDGLGLVGIVVEALNRRIFAFLSPKPLFSYECVFNG
jgi:hypothetical protein